MAEEKSPKLTKPYMLGRLSEEQDSALDAAARELSRRRGTAVYRAGVMREALALYFVQIGMVWPC